MSAARQADCIFCKIIAGQIPSHRGYEDGHVFSLLDIGPVAKGHTLIIPKRHYVTIDQMPDKEAAACAAVLPTLSKAVAKAAGVEAWNVLQNNGKSAGQVVMHVHFHIIPRTEGDALGFRWPAGKLDDATAKELMASITSSLPAQS